MSAHTPGIIHEGPVDNVIADFGIQSEVSLFYRLASLPVLRKRQWSETTSSREQSASRISLEKAFVEGEMPVSLTRHLERGDLQPHGDGRGSRPMNGHFHCAAFPSERHGCLSALKNSFYPRVALPSSTPSLANTIYVCGRRNLPVSREGQQSEICSLQGGAHVIQIFTHLARETAILCSRPVSFPGRV